MNAGHKRGACAYRCEGEGKAVRAFHAFAPAALAGIGSLPATLRETFLPTRTNESPLAIYGSVAQEFRATITGRVTDASGSAVAGAKVEVKGIATGTVQSTRTGDDDRRLFRLVSGECNCS